MSARLGRTDPYDALTLEVEKAATLARHVLEELRTGDLDSNDTVFALEVIVEVIVQQHEKISVAAGALLPKPRRQTGGAPAAASSRNLRVVDGSPR